MAHHGPNPFGALAEGQEAEFRKLRDMLGETGKFPDGKISPDDEGEICMGVAADAGLVRLEFGKPVAWLACTPDQARGIAVSLMRAADNARLINTEKSREEHSAKAG